MLDLRGELLALDAQHIVAETVGLLHPIDARICGVVRIEVARGPAELARERNGAQQF